MNNYIDEISAKFNVSYEHTEAIIEIVKRTIRGKKIRNDKFLSTDVRVNIDYIGKALTYKYVNAFSGRASGLPHYSGLPLPPYPSYLINYNVSFYDGNFNDTISIELDEIKREIRDIKINKIIND